jgi:hypothetical protein
MKVGDLVFHDGWDEKGIITSICQLTAPERYFVTFATGKKIVTYEEELELFEIKHK